MTNREWADLIESKEENLIEEGVEAYEKAKHSDGRFIVEITEDGKIFTWEDIAGGTSFTESSYNGKSMVVLEFCFKYDDMPEITDNQLIALLGDDYKSIAEAAKVEKEPLLFYVLDNCPEIKDDIHEIEEENYEDEIDENKYQDVCDQLCIRISELRSCR